MAVGVGKKGQRFFFEIEEQQAISGDKERTECVVTARDVRGDGIFPGYLYKYMEKEGVRGVHCAL